MCLRRIDPVLTCLSCMSVLQAVAAKEKAVQELADAKKKFVHMTRRRQAEHTAKVRLRWACKRHWSAGGPENLATAAALF